VLTVRLSPTVSNDFYSVCLVAIKRHAKRDTKMTEFKAQLLASIDSRAAYELSKNAENTSIQKTVSDVRKACDNDVLISVMLASNVNADFINKSERVSARMNVYAVEKVINVARHVAKASVLNRYTLAIVKAAIALAKADLLLTHADAVAACSLDVAHKDKSRAAIIKSARYAKHVAANTASTQSSSSINALQAFNVLTETRDSANHVCYSLNNESVALAEIKAALQ
jgi:hypothetical protein